MKPPIPAALLAMALAATSCGADPDTTHGTVVDRRRSIKPLIMTLVIKESDGRTVHVHVHRHAFRHPHGSAPSVRPLPDIARGRLLFYLEVRRP